jgi:hypothetical protein
MESTSGEDAVNSIEMTTKYRMQQNTLKDLNL